MSDSRPVPTDPTTVSRRRFLGATGAGIAGASLVDMLAARRAPAQLRGTSLRMLKWSHFVPAYDAGHSPDGGAMGARGWERTVTRSSPWRRNITGLGMLSRGFLASSRAGEVRRRVLHYDGGEAP